MAKMQQPSASGLFRSIKLFVRDLLSDTQRSVDEVAEAVQAFFYETEEAIAQHPLWHGCEPEELDKACDALEKFVTTKLYDKVFLTDAEERENDRLLEERLQHLRFVTVEHLSVSPAFCAAYPWAGAQQELCKMATYRTPRDKLVRAQLLQADQLVALGHERRLARRRRVLPCAHLRAAPGEPAAAPRQPAVHCALPPPVQAGVERPTT